VMETLKEEISPPWEDRGIPQENGGGGGGLLSPSLYMAVLFPLSVHWALNLGVSIYLNGARCTRETQIQSKHAYRNAQHYIHDISTT